VTIRPAAPGDVDALVDVAAATFPLACPPGSHPDAIAAHIRERLGVPAFEAWLADPGATLLVAEGAGRLDGYALALTGPCSDAEAAVALEARGVATGRIHELSKIYVRPEAHGGGAAGALLEATLDAVRTAHGAGPAWLGTNADNARARAFYARHGFALVGERTYRVGGQDHADVVMLRAGA